MCLSVSLTPQSRAAGLCVVRSPAAPLSPAQSLLCPASRGGNTCAEIAQCMRAALRMEHTGGWRPGGSLCSLGLPAAIILQGFTQTPEALKRNWFFHLVSFSFEGALKLKGLLCSPPEQRELSTSVPKAPRHPNTQPAVLRLSASSYSCQTSTGGTETKCSQSDYIMGGKKVKKASKWNLEINLDCLRNKCIISLWHSIATVLVTLWQRTRNCLWEIICDGKEKKIKN